ncbi:hypothetical protein [Aurantibacter sp.]|uniref:hypothetical protein n=1 Tax=Aurantibacter sp. TaxID=2807103 RepID=UPI0032639538
MEEQKNNPFEELERSVHEVPPNMKSKVMSDIANAKLVMDMAALYTCNIKSAINDSVKPNK